MQVGRRMSTFAVYLDQPDPGAWEALRQNWPERHFILDERVAFVAPEGIVLTSDVARTVGVATDAGGGNGNGSEARLRALEIHVARIDERVSAIQENMATKNDMTGLKVWILGGVLAATLIAASIAATIVKAFY